MKKVAIFMSDFHLGQGDRMEEFHADKEFSELLCRLSQEHADDDVDLVLLGDVMDLWTTITEAKEVNAQTSTEVPLYFPVDLKKPAAKTSAVQKELDRAKAVMDAHPLFFDALGRFLIRAPHCRRIVYVPGNHDHSVVAQELQTEIRRRILGDDVLELGRTLLKRDNLQQNDLENRIEFLFCYENEDLQVYAEHGNQLTYKGVFKYENFRDFGNECPGYYELKLVWNRLERRNPDFDNVFMGALSPAMWPGLFWWFLNPFQPKNWTAFRSLRKFRVQYKDDNRAEVKAARALMPSALKTVLYLLWASRFGVTRDEFSDQIPWLFANATSTLASDISATDTSLRVAEGTGVKFPCPTTPEYFWATLEAGATREIIKATERAGDTFTIVRGREGTTASNFSKDATIKLRLTVCGDRLDPAKIKTVILGHSHHAKDRDLPGFDGVKYYNLGSWIYRFENGRGVVEQTWVSISRDLEGEVVSTSPDRSRITVQYKSTCRGEVPVTYRVDPEDLIAELRRGQRVILERDDRGIVRNIVREPFRRNVVDQHMFRRKVELSVDASNPVGKDGCRLNPVTRGMLDILVGDVVLYHWNFGVTLKRLLFSLKLPEFFRVVPEMIFSYINRTGSSSYWSHSTMVYGSPSETAESTHYADPIFLEAVPRTGVGLHGPQHYLAHPNEWDLAVLRSKAKWLTGIANWGNRIVLRRIAASAIDLHYDNSAVASITLYRASRMLDERHGKPFVAGFVKGGLFGIVVLTLWVLFAWVIPWLLANLWETLRTAWTIAWLEGFGVVLVVAKEWAVQTWRDIFHWLGQIGPVALLWKPVYDLFQSGDWVLKAIVLALMGILTVVLILAIYAIVRVIWVAYWRAAFAVGAFWGVLMVPVMADLAKDWRGKSYEQRWAMTLVWMLIPLLAMFSWSWSDDPMRVAFWVLSTAVVVVWFSDVLTEVVAPIIEPIVSAGVDLVRRVREKLFQEEAYICSGLIQHALLCTAGEVKKNPQSIMVNPQWTPQMPPAKERRLLRETLPQHFSQAEEKFDWVYLVINGEIRHRPGIAHRAEVNPDPLQITQLQLNPQSPFTLSRQAAWSLKLALLGLYCIVLYELLGKSWERWLVLGDLWLGFALGVCAIVLAHFAWKELVLNPRTVRGRSLTWWGGRLGWLAAASAAAAYLSA